MCPQTEFLSVMQSTALRPSRVGRFMRNGIDRSTCSLIHKSDTRISSYLTSAELNLFSGDVFFYLFWGRWNEKAVFFLEVEIAPVWRRFSSVRLYITFFPRLAYPGFQRFLALRELGPKAAGHPYFRPQLSESEKPLESRVRLALRAFLYSGSCEI